MKTHNLRTILSAAPFAMFSGNILVQAQTLTTIHSFAGGDGEYPFPYGRLQFDSNGALYGTTASGGARSWGTVYELVPPTVQGSAWTEKVLYSFQGGADGAQPGTGVVFDHLGNSCLSGCFNKPQPVV